MTNSFNISKIAICIIIGLIVGSLVTLALVHDKNTTFIGNVTVKKLQQVNFTRMPVTIAPTSNPVHLSSVLITSTENHPTYTILNLENGMRINQTDSTIKSGKSVSLNYQIYEPVCTYKIYVNSTLYNGTIDELIVSNKYNFTKVPNSDCDANKKILSIIDWHLN